MSDLLSIKNLCYSYHTEQGETHVIDNVSFSIHTGEFVAIVGPSGCGKSTLLSLICGLLTPDEGSICLENGRNIGYMLQRDHLLPWRTTLQNITLGLEINHSAVDEHYIQIDQFLGNYGLIHFKNAKPESLSGGMRQRVALIRTLVLSPDLLLLDEPFSALDYQTRLHVADDVYDILKQEKKTALLITHDISEAISMADRILVFSKRPTHILKEIPISLTYVGKRTPFLSRSAPEFKDYFNQVWEVLEQS